MQEFINMEKYNLDRKKFIEWVSLKNFINDVRPQIQDDLIKGGEYIITADEILNNIQFKEIPTHLLIDYSGKGKYVSAKECALIYTH